MVVIAIYLNWDIAKLKILIF